MSSSCCELCQRPVISLTKHHLIPQTRHKNKKRLFTRDEVKNRILWLCCPCHNNIHVHFSNKELELGFNTLKILINHPTIQKFTIWIKDKPTALHISFPIGKRYG